MASRLLQVANSSGALPFLTRYWTLPASYRICRIRSFVGRPRVSSLRQIRWKIDIQCPHTIPASFWGAQFGPIDYLNLRNAQHWGVCRSGVRGVWARVFWRLGYIRASVCCSGGAWLLRLSVRVRYWYRGYPFGYLGYSYRYLLYGYLVTNT